MRLPDISKLFVAVFKFRGTRKMLIFSSLFSRTNFKGRGLITGSVAVIDFPNLIAFKTVGGCSDLSPFLQKMSDNSNCPVFFGLSFPIHSRPR